MESKYTKPQSDLNVALFLLEEYLKENGHDWKKLQSKYSHLARMSFSEMKSPKRVGDIIIRLESV